MNINLHIERLILDDVGINSHEANVLKAALESQLREQLMNQGISTSIQSAGNRQSVKGGSIPIDSNRKPASLGEQIGNAVFKGVGK